MRKVKLLALLLAALMVVAAFAGCADTTAIESDVANLEDRVDALEGKVDSAVSGIDDVKDALEADKTAEELKKIQDANNALLEQIKKLQEDLKKAEEKIDEKPATPEAPVIDTAALQKLADEYGAKIGRLQAEVMAEQDYYFAADYVAILESLTAAQTEIATAGTVDAMKAVFANLEKKLAGFTKVDAKFYAYYLTLKGNYVGDEACLDLVKEADEYFDTAAKHFAETNVADWTVYATGEVDKKGNAVKVDLDDCLADMLVNWPADLEEIEAEAERIVNAIEAIEPEDTYSELAGIAADYAAWKKTAAALAPVHANLVTNYADLVAAQAASLNFTVAETIVKQLTIAPMFGESADVALFEYFEDGVFNPYVFVAVDEDGEFVTNDGEVVYVSDIYEAIIAAIDTWADENDITDDVAEFLINKWYFGGNADAYATVKNLAAFVASMEAEYAKVEAIAKNIKALNTKKLSASQELFTAYNNNADAINKWFDDAVKAYKAACDAADKADKDAADTRAVPADAYAMVLEANFNEMVVLAGLGAEAKNADGDKIFVFGDVENYVLGIVGDKETSSPNYNYIQFYNFDDAKTGEFLKTTFVEAEAIADAINEKVAKYPVLTQTSVVNFLTTIGGYYTLNADASKLVANENASVNTVAGFLATYGKNGTAYADYSSKNRPDLSALVDVAAYNKVVTDLFARIDAIDTATAALNKAYADLLGTYDEVVLTTANTGAVATLVKAVTEWKKVGGRDDVVIATKAANKDEYTLVNVVEAYESLKANPDFDAIIAKVEARSALIVKEANMLVSLFKMLDEVNKFAPINFSNLGKTNNLKGNYAITKVVESTTVDPETKKAGVSVTYVVFDGSKFTTKTNYQLNGFDGTSASSALSSSTYVSKFQGLIKTIDTDVTGKTISDLAGWKNSAFYTSDLIAIASNLYAKFMVDNYGVKDANVEAAKATFVAANNGYEFYGWHRDIYNALNKVGYSSKALESATTLDAITLALNAAAKDPNLSDAAAKIFEADIVRGGAYAGADMSADFKLSDEAYAELDVDLSDYNVTATTIWAAPELQ